MRGGGELFREFYLEAVQVSTSALIRQKEDLRHAAWKKSTLQKCNPYGF
jgi:hypothetical protein